ncbi:MAG: AAA family ATPase, partial [Bifidobacteriaceae bacterium]|nr:AAA family ATPase [Bifidobacteriaceae bacterium]
MCAYRRRIIDDVLDQLQPHLRATMLQGPKAVGKTATATRRVQTVLNLDWESHRMLLQSDPTILGTLPGPILVDEWQRLPESWDLIRRAVDTGSPPGHFFIAGSSAPKGATVHSGAGRIVPFRMRPLSLAERGIETPQVSLQALIEGETQVSGTTEVGLA